MGGRATAAVTISRKLSRLFVRERWELIWSISQSSFNKYVNSLPSVRYAVSFLGFFYRSLSRSVEDESVNDTSDTIAGGLTSGERPNDRINLNCLRLCSEMHLPRRSVLLREQEPPLNNIVIHDGGIMSVVYDARQSRDCTYGVFRSCLRFVVTDKLVTTRFHRYE